MKHLIFDFGAVVFQWQPAALLARVLPQHAHDEASTQALQRDFFQGYGGVWGRYDRGTIERPELIAGLAAQTGLHADEVAAVVCGAAAGALPGLAAFLAMVGRAVWRGRDGIIGAAGRLMKCPIYPYESNTCSGHE